MSVRRSLVAIVDDDPRLRDAVEELFESAGYASSSFASAEALLSSGLSDVDVLITDIGMPGMDGFALRERVMRLRPELPVFLITGRHEIVDQGRARDIAGFFRKPFDAVALLAAVETALQQSDDGGGDGN